jgi:hypothetical protein
MDTRRRFTHTESLKDRVIAFAADARDKANLLPPGPERDILLKKARQADTAAHIDEWASSPGLQSPK